MKVVTLEAVNAYGERSTTRPRIFGKEEIVLWGRAPRRGKASGELV